MQSLVNRVAHSRRFWNIACRFWPARPFNVPGGQGFVSFTFDDFPASALEQGGAILERYDARGTYYWSGRFTLMTDPNVGPLAASHLRAVADRGHEVACHSYGHLDCATVLAHELDDDIARNATAAAHALSCNSATFEHFAYPYGQVSLAGRRVVAGRFSTGRGIFPGVNRGWSDAALLRANALYGGNDVYIKAISLIREVASHGGWLIFFTHDVSDTPSAYGTRTDAFEEVVHAARESGCSVLPLGRVAAQFLPPRRARPILQE